MSYIEVFRDYHSDAEVTDELIAGIDLVNAIVQNITILNTKRKIKITKPGLSRVEHNSIRSFPKLPANMSIVITDRPIYSEYDINGFEFGDIFYDIKNRFKDVEASLTTIKGVAITGKGSDFAIISTFHGGDIRETVAHEIAHLYGLKQRGIKHDAEHEGHCVDNKCIMHYESQKDNVAVEEYVSKKDKLFRLLGKKSIKYYSSPVATEFCTNCSDELLNNSKDLAVEHVLHFMSNT